MFGRINFSTPGVVKVVQRKLIFFLLTFPVAVWRRESWLVVADLFRNCENPVSPRSQATNQLILPYRSSIPCANTARQPAQFPAYMSSLSCDFPALREDRWQRSQTEIDPHNSVHRCVQQNWNIYLEICYQRSKPHSMIDILPQSPMLI